MLPELKQINQHSWTLVSQRRRKRYASLLQPGTRMSRSPLSVSAPTCRCWCPSAHVVVTAFKTQKKPQVSSSSATPSSSKTCSTGENSFQSRRLWHIWRKLYLQLPEYHLLRLCPLQTSENKSWFPMLLLLTTIWRHETPKCCRIIFSVNFLFITFSTLSIF